MSDFSLDIRYAWRKILKGPGFAIVVVLTLALGIGGTTAVFTFLNAVLLRPLPVADPERLVWVGGVSQSRETAITFSYPDYEELRAGRAPLSGLAAFGMRSFRLDHGDEEVATVGALVSDNYFGVLGIRPARGRFWNAADVAAGPQVVISDHLWRHRFGADPGIVGREIRVNGQPATVTGVAPAGFGGTINLVGLDLWVPLASYPLLYPGKELREPGHAWLQIIGRMAPGVSRSAVQEALGARARQARVGAGYQSPKRGVVVEPLGGLNGPGRSGSTRLSSLLFGTALLVLVIASANVAGMLTARNALRRSEMAVRAALGATPGRLVSQLLTETLAIWTAGGVAGLLLAAWLGTLLPKLVPAQQSFPARLGLNMGVDGRVLAFACALTLLSGLAFGLMPAVHASRTDLVHALKEQFDPGRRRSRGRSALTAAQVACSLLLLVNAGLLLKSVRELSTGSPGFDPDGVTVVPLDLTVAGEDARGSQRRAQAFFPELLRRLETKPDLRSASITTSVPLDGADATTQVWFPVRGASAIGPIQVEVGYAAVSPEYFNTLRIPIVRGRGFEAGDRLGGQPVAVVSAAMARQFWPSENPVGKTLRQGDLPLLVVGVARDVRAGPVGGAPRPALYVPFDQQPELRASVLVRGSGPVGRSVAEEVRSLDPNVARQPPASLRDVLVAAMPHRFLVPVLGAFGLLGLVLSTIGIYGLVAYFTAHRTREFSIRMALGARPRDIVRAVVGRGLVLAAVGVAVGLPLTLATARLLKPLLAGTSTLDPVTYGAVALLLAATSVCASLLPALRATRIHPMSGLRAE